MRSWKSWMVVLALLGGATSASLAAKAAPLAVSITAAQPDVEPLVQTARWHGRRHWRRHHGWHRRYHQHHHWRRHVHHHRHVRHRRRLPFY